LFVFIPYLLYDIIRDFNIMTFYKKEDRTVTIFFYIIQNGGR